MFEFIQTSFTAFLAIELPLTATLNVSLGAAAISMIVFRAVLGAVRGFIHG
jgi:hypothetical protein